MPLQIRLGGVATMLEPGPQAEGRLLARIGLPVKGTKYAATAD